MADSNQSRLSMRLPPPFLARNPGIGARRRDAVEWLN
jgi:hypothetical protein